ncbi:NRDE family protein [Aspergillus stella-maris]|uniref:NRDE family protein n=1 Tax=Aspergillus stella-maris TaxID=1810926 RepID=UPI003CCE3163
MCIAILSTTHPDYRFIILNNRDEFLSRPTAPAEWWTPEPSPISSPSYSPPPTTPLTNLEHKSTRILSARDLARPAHGTWLGINADGRLGVLTNCLEKVCARAVGGLSRGGVIKRWLISTSDNDGDEEEGGDKDGKRNILSFVNHLTGLRDVGGFNLLLGDVRNEQLAIISNRSAGTDCCPEDEEGQVKIRWIDHNSDLGETIALSNMTLSDSPESPQSEKWKKMTLGEDLTSSAIQASVGNGDDEDALLNRLFGVLSTDTLSRLPGGLSEDAETYLGLLRESIFIPVIGKPVQLHEQKEGEVLNSGYMQGLYGTQTQTVMLVGYDGRVRFVARTLYDDGGRRRLNSEEGEGVNEFVFTAG